MDLSGETKRKLRDMGASDLLAALEAQDEGMCMGMTCPNACRWPLTSRARRS